MYCNTEKKRFELNFIPFLRSIRPESCHIFSCFEILISLLIASELDFFLFLFFENAHMCIFLWFRTRFLFFFICRYRFLFVVAKREMEIKAHKIIFILKEIIKIQFKYVHPYSYTRHKFQFKKKWKIHL